MKFDWKSKWWEVSVDELQNRMFLVKKYRTDPVTEVNKELYRCVDKVLKKLGVDVESDEVTIEDQCNFLGIKLQSNDDPRTPQLNGIFFFVYKLSLVSDNVDIIAYAWVSKPKPQKKGTAKCEIQYFQENKMEESREVKIIV